MSKAAKQLLFYDNPVPLMLDKHAEAGLLSDIDFSFSKETNSVPVVYSEFAEAAKYYPIVFAGNEKSDAVAILGLESSKNNMVNKEGRWAKDKYVPAYVRRYPFAFMSADDNKLILCVDEGSKFYQEKQKDKKQRFFEGTEQTNLTKNALQFCAQFHDQQVITQKLVAELAEENLLIDQQITVTPPQAKGKQYNLSGFKVVDSEKLKNLSPEKLQQWNKNGLLNIIYIHLMSLTNFSKFSAK